jgi:hypothetical protein
LQPLRVMPPLSVHLRLLSLRCALFAPLSRVFDIVSVHLPESFRGGCSFGTSKTGSPDDDNFIKMAQFAEQHKPFKRDPGQARYSGLPRLRRAGQLC